MEIHIELLLKHLDRQRFAPAFFVPSSPHTPIHAQLLDRVKDFDVPIVHAPKTRGLKVGTSADNIVSFARALRQVDADLLHMHHWRSGGDRYPVLAAAMVRTRGVIRTEHLPPDPNTVTDALRRTCRRLDRRCDVVLHVSEGNRRQHLELLGRDPAKLKVLHNGIEIGPNPTDDERRRAKIRFGFDPDTPLLGTIGRLDHQKAHNITLRSIPLVKAAVGQVNVVIVGEGELRGELEQLAVDLGVSDQVRFTGFMSETADILAAFDVALMPSRYEGLALSMLEMMAAAKPCVFSDHESFVEGTAAGTVARLVPIDDAGALADSVVGLLREPDAARELGRRARAHVVENFSIAKHIESLMDLYDRVLAKER